jgi:hypothetical protein
MCVCVTNARTPTPTITQQHNNTIPRRRRRTEALEKALQSNMPDHNVWYEWEAREAEIVAECEKKGG